MKINGIHHITAVTSNIEQNVDFYTRVLGLRLVKKTVNQDDISAYHLFYADQNGSPGTDMTFFDWPRMGRNQPGTNSISGTVFRVLTPEALHFWEKRLKENGAMKVDFATFNGRNLLYFEDPEGQPIYLSAESEAQFEGQFWKRPDIPDQFTLRGFYSVIISVPDISALEPVLRGLLGFEETTRATWIDSKTPAAIFHTSDEGGPGREVWVIEEANAPRASLGAGGVHHVAFRVRDQREQEIWRERILAGGLRVSQSIDRFWFRSIYFRVPGGILFEIATDGPGFDIDEELDELGEKLVLPPFLENQRHVIEAQLVPIGE